MTLQLERSLDSFDWEILRQLQADARLSYNELSRRVGLSSPAVAERVRRLEESGVIAGYRAEVDPAKIGLPIMALIQLRCDRDKCLLKTATASEFPEIVEVLKVTGDYCTHIKIVASSIAHLEAIKGRLGERGSMSTSLIYSSALSRRIIDWEHGIPDVETPPEWQ
jgi:Lrp/AsnC family leucine-responsive transcriptional regulator